MSTTKHFFALPFAQIAKEKIFTIVFSQLSIKGKLLKETDNGSDL